MALPVPLRARHKGKLMIDDLIQMACGSSQAGSAVAPHGDATARPSTSGLRASHSDERRLRLADLHDWSGTPHAAAQSHFHKEQFNA